MSPMFQRFAGSAAILVGIGGLAYGLLFGAIVQGAGRGVAIAWNVLGLLGALLAIPAAATIQITIREYLRFRRGEPPPPTPGPAASSAAP